MALFMLTKCPGCGYENRPNKPIHTAERCQAKGTEIPLRCKHAADPVAHAAWSSECYEVAGVKYPLVKRPAKLATDSDLELSEEEIAAGSGYRLRMVLDEAATLRQLPLEPPATIPHMHCSCSVCGEEWVEVLRKDGE